MEVPEAHISHQSPGRLRIRIPSRRGDAVYFSEVRGQLSRLRRFPQLDVNPLTGGVLLAGEPIDPAAIAEYGHKQNLFRLKLAHTASKPLMHAVAEPVARIDDAMKRLTGGTIDLPGSVFLLLLGFGIYEIARGRLSIPPWYTAFWYAFGLMSMYVIEKKVLSNPDQLSG